MQYLKTNHYRDKKLLKLAQGRMCLFQVPNVCFGIDPDTTVAAHSNESRHGKGKSIKAEDHYSAWACVSCHAWYDTSLDSREDKRRAFELAHKRQVQAWDSISESEQESAADRETATRALIQIDKDEAFYATR